MEQRRFSSAKGRSFGGARGGSRFSRPTQGGSRSAAPRGDGHRSASHTGGAQSPRSYGRSDSAHGSRTGGHSSYRGSNTGSFSARSSYGPRPSTGHASHGSATGGSYRGGDSQGGYRSSGSRPTSGYRGRSSFGSRPSYSASRGGSRFGGGRSGGGRRGGGSRDERIDASRFINKAVITEEIEHFTPEHAFTDFKIGEGLKKAITAKGFKNPTPIQDRSIPHILQGADVVGIANTGTGKTGAFLIPLIHKVLENPREGVLVVVPTRELAMQIDEELQGFVRGLQVRSVCCFGGANISRQIEALRQHRHFVIGTPGRLKDLIERRKLNLSGYKTVVLDEADRMLDMGFVHDMRTIMAQLSKERQTLFFSATLSPDIEKLIGEFLKEPVRISVKTRDTSKNIDQDVVRVPRGGSKFDILVDLLKKTDFTRVLVFGRTKHGVDKLTKLLLKAGVSAESIHGNKNNAKRQQALKLFKAGRIRVMVATDVAARGLDIADVSHVINFDVPATYDDYVHRIGRTGRGEKKGTALTFIEE